MKNTLRPPLIYFPSFILLLILCLACARPYSYPGTGPFFISLEQDNKNGIQGESRLIMVPAPEEYRADDWKTLTVSVKVPEQPGEDGRMLALKTAWERLLIKEGTRSITGRSESSEQHLHSRLTLRYEGIIDEPIRIVSFIRENDHLHLSLETKFSALAFPEDWEKLRKKRNRKEHLKDILSVFH